MKTSQIDHIAAELARRIRRYEEDLDLGTFKAMTADELRARQKANHRQNKLIRRALRAKRKGGA